MTSHLDLTLILSSPEAKSSLNVTFERESIGESKEVNSSVQCKPSEVQGRLRCLCHNPTKQVSKETFRHDSGPRTIPTSISTGLLSTPDTPRNRGDLSVGHVHLCSVSTETDGTELSYIGGRPGRSSPFVDVFPNRSRERFSRIRDDLSVLPSEDTYDSPIFPLMSSQTEPN